MGIRVEAVCTEVRRRQDYQVGGPAGPRGQRQTTIVWDVEFRPAGGDAIAALGDCKILLAGVSEDTAKQYQVDHSYHLQMSGESAPAPEPPPPPPAEEPAAPEPAPAPAPAPAPRRK